MTDKYIPLYVLVFFISFFFTVIGERKLIPALSSKAKQPIYTEGPSWHIKKNGTPTMGGLAFLLASFIGIVFSFVFLWIAKEFNTAISLIITMIFTVCNSFIGIIDDITKIKKKRNKGLSAKQKLFLQFLFATAFIFARFAFLDETTLLHFSFGYIDLGVFYYPISILAILGTVNCANLTDGIDGLASCVSFSIAIVLFYFSATVFRDVAILSCAIIGATLGFLFFNIHPAKIFMGDTGSLFLGAFAIGALFSLSNPILILFIGIVYLIEGISVIFQVAFFKFTGKRIFKMAPLHHHLEKSGMSETKICIIAVLLTLLMSVFAFMMYLP